MIRALLTAAAALLLLGAAKPATVDYRLGAGPAGLSVGLRLRGDADGETRLSLPPAFAGLDVKGAAATWDGPSTAVLRHRPGAKLTVRYRLTASAGEPPGGFALDGARLFAEPQGRASDTATFRFDRLPKGWTGASDLEGRPLAVADLRAATGFVGGDLTVVTRPLAGGSLRVAARRTSGEALAPPADALARLVTAETAYWAQPVGPAFVALAVAPDDPGMVRAVALTRVREAIPAQLGSGAAPTWLAAGFAGLIADRILLRADLAAPLDVVGRMDAADHVRGQLLALKWDEEIRRKTGGKADLDDVILRMRDHYRQFPPGQGPDVVTGLVSAAWVVAKVDLRPDIAKYADGGAAIPLPEQLFDGCLDARVTVSPGFDSGFDHAASATAKVVKGVRRRGPAWNSGLRDGMRIDAMNLKPGDMTREIELTVRPARGNAKPRKLRYWPYGDTDVEARTLQLAMGLSGEALAACGRKIGGL